MLTSLKSPCKTSLLHNGPLLRNILPISVCIVCDPSHNLLPCAPPCPPLTTFHYPEEAQCLFDALYPPQAPYYSAHPCSPSFRVHTMFQSDLFLPPPPTPTANPPVKLSLLCGLHFSLVLGQRSE